MKYSLAVFSSITYANRIKKLLDNKLGYVALMHAPAGITDAGCAYCLRFRSSDISTVKATAEEYGVTIRGFFEEEGNSFRRIAI